MKTMTCKQLAGACDMEFHAETFDEMAKLSKDHGTEMFEKGDEIHMSAIKKMMQLMKDPKAMGKWMNKKRKEFDALPQDK